MADTSIKLQDASTHLMKDIKLIDNGDLTYTGDLTPFIITPIDFSESSAIETGATVTSTRSIASTRVSAVLIGILAPAVKIFGKVISSSVLIGDIVSAARVVGYMRSSAIIAGDAISAARKIVVSRISSIISGIIVTAKGNKSYFIYSSIISGISIVASRLSGYIRNSSNEIGINNQDISPLPEGGAGAIDRPSYQGGSSTFLDFTNPIDSDGTIDTVEIWCHQNAVGVKVGVFYGSGDMWTYRDGVTLGSVSAGSKQVFENLNFETKTGDVLGYWANNSASIELSTTGGSGVWGRTVDEMKPGSAKQYYVHVAQGCISLYFTGTLKMASRQVSYNRFSTIPNGVTASASKVYSTVKSAIVLIGTLLGATRLASYNRSADNKTGIISTASRGFNIIRNSSIISGAVITASRIRTATRSATIEIGTKISASKLISYIRQSSIGQGIIISASKAVSIIRNSSIIAGIVVTAKGGKSFWKNSFIIAGVSTSASRIFAFIRIASVPVNITISAIARIFAFGFKVLSISRKFYSLILNRKYTDLDIK